MKLQDKNWSLNAMPLNENWNWSDIGENSRNKINLQDEELKQANIQRLLLQEETERRTREYRRRDGNASKIQ